MKKCPRKDDRRKFPETRHGQQIRPCRGNAIPVNKASLARRSRDLND